MPQSRMLRSRYSSRCGRWAVCGERERHWLSAGVDSKGERWYDWQCWILAEPKGADGQTGLIAPLKKSSGTHSLTAFKRSRGLARA